MNDGSSQCAVTGTRLDHVEDRRLSEQMPHLFQLARNQSAEQRMAHGGGPEMAADPLPPAGVKAPLGRVQADLHELSERDPAVRAD
jgi:hypothetical protein